VLFAKFTEFILYCQDTDDVSKYRLSLYNVILSSITSFMFPVPVLWKYDI